MATFNEFIEKNNVTMKSQYIGTAEDDDRFEWLVTVSHDGKSKRFDYFMGMAHCKFVANFYDRDYVKKNRWKFKTISHLERFGRIKPNKPELPEVLKGLALDSSVYWEDVGEWIDDMGYESAAEGIKVYNACKVNLDKIKELFPGKLEEFLQLEEDCD